MGRSNGQLFTQVVTNVRGMYVFFDDDTSKGEAVDLFFCFVSI